MKVKSNRKRAVLALNSGLSFKGGHGKRKKKTKFIVTKIKVSDAYSSIPIPNEGDSSSMSTVEEDNESLASTASDQNIDDEDLPERLDASDASQFFNSSNSRQVLLLLKRKIYFNGALRIRLLAGQVSIFGYEMHRNETVIANSPRGHSFLCLSSCRQQASDNIKNGKIINDYLKGFSRTFLSSDLQEIRSSFNSSTDAVLLLENDANNKSIYMVEKYMKETVFPNIYRFTCRPFYHFESILRCQFLPHTKFGLRINPEWENIFMTTTSRQAIIGGKGVGKSTLLRYLINKNVNEFKKILLIDLDIGQPEMFLPQTVSATVITEPILGPGYLQNKSPHKSYLYGDVNVLVSSIKYLKCVLKLLEYCSDSEELRTIPWVINTMGYNRGFGFELMAVILRKLNPTDVIQIQASKSDHNFEQILNAEEVNSLVFKFFKNEVQGMQPDCTYSTHVCNTMLKTKQKKFWDITPKDQRFAMLLSKLGNILQGNANWITDVKPVCASLDDLKIVMVSDDKVTNILQPKIINGNLVYLCQTTEADLDDETIVECFGLGIVRGVEMVTNKVYLLSAITPMELQHVNTLAICSIPLPTPIPINQSSRTVGCVPFVYSSKNFIGCKQIVPISYRPDKQKPNG